MKRDYGYKNKHAVLRRASRAIRRGHRRSHSVKVARWDHDVFVIKRVSMRHLVLTLFSPGGFWLLGSSK